MMEKAREDISRGGLILIREGLTEGSSGNISIFDRDQGLMAISPSGMNYESIRPEDVPVLDMEGNIVEGDKKPSSEYALHLAIYRKRPEAGSVVHAHSPYCTTLACMGESIKGIHYAIAESGCISVPLVRYECFGTPELAAAVEEKAALSPGLLLANHGMCACGGDMSAAFALARNMEWTAMIQWRCMCAGKIQLLNNEQMEKAVDRFSTYGQCKGGYFS